jgi:hypothetical protein
MPAAPLALWEPATHPLGFIGEAQRAKRMSQVAQNKQGNLGDWRQELASNGRLELLGYDVYPPLIESLAELDLLNLIGSTPRSVFVGRFQGMGAADPLTEALRERGFLVETAAFGVSESWWFHNEFVSESGGNLISATADWLAAAIEQMV